MKRVLSGVVGLGLAVGLVGGQPPATDKPADEKKPLGVEVKFPAKGPSLEEAIATALRNHPDVRVAEAEVQVAQAKLAQSRLVVAQKAAAAHAAVERTRAEVKTAEDHFAHTQQLVKKGFAPQTQEVAHRMKLEAAKAAAATAEAEYNAVLGVMPGKAAAADIEALRSVVRLAGVMPGEWKSVVLGSDGQTFQLTTDASVSLTGTKTAPGGVADKLRTGLDKPVKLGEGGQNFAQFVDWLGKEAGLGVPFRVILRDGNDPPVFIREPATLSVGAVLQLLEDENPGIRFVIREYGVLVTDAKTLPPGAVTVQEFWKQVRAEKAKGADAPKK